MNFVQPFRVGKARLTHERGVIAGVRPIALFGFEKSPVYRAAIVPLMVGGIEIGRNIFEIAAQISLDQTGKAGHRGTCFIAVVGLHHSGGDPELFQGGVPGRRLSLPHDYLIIRPRMVGRRYDE